MKFCLVAIFIFSIFLYINRAEATPRRNDDDHHWIGKLECLNFGEECWSRHCPNGGICRHGYCVCDDK